MGVCGGGLCTPRDNYNCVGHDGVRVDEDEEENLRQVLFQVIWQVIQFDIDSGIRGCRFIFRDSGGHYYDCKDARQVEFGRHGWREFGGILMGIVDLLNEFGATGSEFKSTYVLFVE